MQAGELMETAWPAVDEQEWNGIGSQRYSVREVDGESMLAVGNGSQIMRREAV